MSVFQRKIDYVRNGNGTWHTFCQIRWKSLTLDDLEGHWQPVRSAILATAGLPVIWSFCLQISVWFYWFVNVVLRFVIVKRIIGTNICLYVN